MKRMKKGPAGPALEEEAPVAGGSVEQEPGEQRQELPPQDTRQYDPAAGILSVLVPGQKWQQLEERKKISERVNRFGELVTGLGTLAGDAIRPPKPKSGQLPAYRLLDEMTRQTLIPVHAPMSVKTRSAAKQEDKDGWDEEALNEYYQELRRDIKRGVSAAYDDYYRREDNPALNIPALKSSRIANLRIAERLMKDSERMITAARRAKDGSYLGGLGRGMGDALGNVENWVSLLELAKNGKILSVIMKSEDGRKLTDDEEQLLDALALNAQMQDYYGSKLGRGYHVGSVVGEGIPAILQGIVSPTGGVVKGVSKQSTKWAFEKLSKFLAGNALKKRAARLLSKTVGVAAGAGVKTALDSPVEIANDAIERKTGDVVYSVGGDGIRFEGTEGGKSWGRSMFEAVGSGYIDNLGDVAADEVAPLVKKELGEIKAAKAVKESKAVQKVLRAVPQKVRDFVKESEWDAGITDYAGQKAADLLNALLIGDRKPEDMADPGKQLDDFISHFIQSGIKAGAKYGKDAAIRKKSSQQLVRQEQNMKDTPGGDSFMKPDDGKNRGEKLMDLVNNHALTREQKLEVLSNVGKLAFHKGVLESMDKKPGWTFDHIEGVVPRLQLSDGATDGNGDGWDGKKPGLSNKAGKIDDEVLTPRPLPVEPVEISRDMPAVPSGGPDARQQKAAQQEVAGGEAGEIRGPGKNLPGKDTEPDRKVVAGGWNPAEIKVGLAGLVEKQRGRLLGTFHHERAGRIDLPWGDAGGQWGMGYILGKPEFRDFFSSVDQAIAVLSDVVNHGKAGEDPETGRLMIEKDGFRALLRRRAPQSEEEGEGVWELDDFVVPDRNPAIQK